MQNRHNQVSVYNVASREQSQFLLWETEVAAVVKYLYNLKARRKAEYHGENRDRRALKSYPAPRVMYTVPGTGATTISILESHSFRVAGANEHNAIRDDLISSFDEVLLGDSESCKNGKFKFRVIGWFGMALSSMDEEERVARAS